MSYARFNSQKYQAYATGGSGIVAADIEGTYATSNNFVRDIITGVYKDNYGAAYENWTVRTGLKFQLTDAVSVLLRYSHAKQNDPTPRRPIPIPTRRSIRRRVSRGVPKHLHRRAIIRPIPIRWPRASRDN